MSLRKVLPAMLLAVCLACPPGAAIAQSQGLKLPEPLFQGFGNNRRTAQNTQNSDSAVRVIQLEDQVRALNGRIEELNFQLLELQELLRKMQEDNEFRFQELESRRGGAKGKSKIARAERPVVKEDLRGKSQPSEQVGPARGSDGDSIAQIIEQNPPARTIDGVELYDGSQGSGTALKPGSLGTMTFDSNGNVVDSDIGRPIDLTRQGQAPLHGVPSNNRNREVASLASSTDAEQLYDLGYNYIQAGDYELAENTFGEFSAKFPDHQKIPEARFWLGESLYSQGQYEEAARVFLDAHKQYGDSRMGPQTLLKLANSLANMDQRELACATYAEVPRKYPDISKAVRNKLNADRNSASCSTN
ncbi:MAG: tol-pal system protein YbgF [Rhizobiaceae bacterium]